MKRIGINPDYTPDLRAARCAAYDSLLRLYGPEPARAGFKFGVMDVVPPLPVFIKLYAPRSRWRFWGRKSKARREAENAIALKRLGVPVPDWIAWGEHRDAVGRLRRAFLITTALPGVCRLDEFASASSWRERTDVLASLAALAARMHRAHFFHYDLHWRNILVRRLPGQSAQLYLIDCPRGGFAWTGIQRRRLHDLATLDKTAEVLCSRAERLRFLRHYLGPTASRQQVRDLARACLKYRRLRWPAARQSDHNHSVDEVIRVPKTISESA